MQSDLGCIHTNLLVWNPKRSPRPLEGTEQLDSGPLEKGGLRLLSSE